MITDGKALTRVCVIGFGMGEVVYGQLVKPPSPITNYLPREVCQKKKRHVLLLVLLTLNPNPSFWNDSCSVRPSNNDSR